MKISWNGKEFEMVKSIDGFDLDPADGRYKTVGFGGQEICILPDSPRILKEAVEASGTEGDRIQLRAQGHPAFTANSCRRQDGLNEMADRAFTANLSRNSGKGFNRSR